MRSSHSFIIATSAFLLLGHPSTSTTSSLFIFPSVESFSIRPNIIPLRGGATTTTTGKKSPINNNNNAKTTSSSSSSVVGMTTAVVGGGEAEGQGGGTSTVTDAVFNLVKSIIGAGVLSLPAGIAAFGNAPSALIPATILIGLVGLISGYTFSLIGRVCSLTSTTSFSTAWDKTVGEKSSWFIAVSCLVDCFAGNLSYSMILADTFKNLLATLGMKVSRTNALLGVTTVVLLPLCLMKNLSSLAPFSLVGILGMMYTSIAIGIRYFGGGYKLPDGKFLVDVAEKYQPSFGTTGAEGVLSPNALILVCMLSTAYIAHFNAPKFYTELKDNTIPRFNKVTTWSFGISVAVYAIVSAMGFLTFGSASDGLILNNYANKDLLMSLSRTAVAISILFSYPLIFVGTRDGILDLAKIPPSKRTNSLLNNLSIVTLGIVTLLAMKITDLSFIASLSGATFGTALIFIYPALMFRNAVKSMGDTASLRLKREGKMANLVAILGGLISAIGMWMTFKGAV